MLQGKNLREVALRARIAPQTAEVYARALAPLLSAGHALSYTGILNYMAAEGANQSAGQLRTLKCAAMHELRIEGRPMPQEQAHDLDLVIQGLATLKSEARTAPRRGAVEDEQLAQLVELAHEEGATDIGDGFVIMHGIACRPRDLAELTPESVNIRSGTVTVRSKRRRYLKVTEGEWETHPIRTEGARVLLERRVRRNTDPTAVLLPGWKTHRASATVKRAAVLYKWRQDRKWDGCHCLRHGAAAAVLTAALDQVRAAGGWSARSSAAHYSRPNDARK